MSTPSDIIVIGGGHAGAEAAWAAARLGIPTTLVTMAHDAIGRMSCNPAIGGIGKGQMVREIDALGGLMGLATDRAGIQFRLLNRRKGPAVWAPRAQCDRKLYANAVQELLANTPNLTIIQGLVDEIETDDAIERAVTAVRLADGRRLSCRCVIVTTGTFLRSLMHTGNKKTAGGRVGEASADGLSGCLRALGLELGRLKTGTPPRVARDTVDYDQCEQQPGDTDPQAFSFMTDALTQPQVPCWITWTQPDAHDLIRANLDRAPMFTGQIESQGPRYCPSIEDKVVRFADKTRHQLFLEPEGYNSDRIYCNGISTSLPIDVQEPLVRSIPGLQHARIVQWGYAVEYDYVPPHQTRATLETKSIRGLFLAGQINGTSGYEEAAGQGLVAGINAARRILGRDPFILGRDQSYIAVMVDDLVTKGTIEPYRMFTSRAEYRLLLRSDNADARLTPIGRDIGLVDDARWKRFNDKRHAVSAFRRWAETTPHNGRRMIDWLGRTDLDIETFAKSDDWKAHVTARINANANAAPRLAEAATAVLIEAKYGGYIARQQREVERFRRMEARHIPEGFDFAAIHQLRHEAREKLTRIAPRSVGQAQRISGISPADIAVLMIHLEGKRRRRAATVG